MTKSADIRSDVQGNNVDAKKLASKQDVHKAESLRQYREMQLMQNISFVDDKSPIKGFSVVQGDDGPLGMAAPNSNEAIAQFQRLESILMPSPPTGQPIGEFEAGLPHIAVSRQQPLRSELAAKLPMFAELMSRLNADETNIVVKNFSIVAEAAMKEATTGISMDAHIANAKRGPALEGMGVSTSNLTVFGVEMPDYGKQIEDAAKQAAEAAEKAGQSGKPFMTFTVTGTTPPLYFIPDAGKDAGAKGPGKGGAPIFTNFNLSNAPTFTVAPGVIGFFNNNPEVGAGNGTGGTGGTGGSGGTGSTGETNPNADGGVGSTGNSEKVYAIPADLLKKIEDSVAQMMKDSPLETMDIDSLMWKVMMECNQDAENEVRDMAKEMEAINLKKKTMRALKQCYRENKTELEGKMRAEFNDLKSNGQIGPGWTEADYFKWRQVAIGKPKTGPDGELMTDKNGKIVMEPPQLATLGMLPPYFSKPKNGLEGGGVAAGNSTGKRVAGDVGDDFGLPDDVEKAMREYFKDYVWDSGLKDMLCLDGEFGQAFHDWAEQTVGLNYADNVDDVAANLNAINSYAWSGAQTPVDAGTLKTLSESNLKNLDEAAEDFKNQGLSLFQRRTEYMTSDADFIAADKAYSDAYKASGNKYPYTPEVQALFNKRTGAMEDAAAKFESKNQGSYEKLEAAKQKFESLKGSYLNAEDQKVFAQKYNDSVQSGLDYAYGFSNALTSGSLTVDDTVDNFANMDFTKNPPTGDNGKTIKIPEGGDPKVKALQDAVNGARANISRELYTDYGLNGGDGLALTVNLYFAATGDMSPTPEEMKKFLEETVGLSASPLESGSNYDKLTKYMTDNEQKLKANEVFDFSKETERLDHLKEGLGQPTTDTTLKFLQDKGFVAKGPSKEQVEYDKKQKEFLEKQDAATGSATQTMPSGMQDGVLTTLEDLDNLEKSTDDEVQNQSEMGELKMLKLQMLMDRRSKFMEGLSNFMAKSSKTGSSIIENLK